MTEIVNMEGFSFGIVTDEILKGKYLSDGNLEVPICEGVFTRKKWDFANEIWTEGASVEEILEASKPIVPQEISRMKFKIQIRRSTIYSYDIILTYLQNLAVNELFTQDDKDELIDRLEDAVSFNRYHKDFINLANMLSVPDEIKDEIFIEGNKIQ